MPRRVSDSKNDPVPPVRTNHGRILGAPKPKLTPKNILKKALRRK